MRIALLALTVALLAPAALAQENPTGKSSERPPPAELEREFTKAGIAAAEGKFELAIEHYERVIRKWPDDRLWMQRAYAHIVGCMMHLRRFDEAERLVKQGPGNIPGLDEKWVEAAMKEIAAERERARREAVVTKMEDERKHLVHAIEKMAALWKEQGVPAEEIEKRIAKMKEEYRAIQERRKTFEEAKRRLEAAGMEKDEVRRRLEEMEHRQRELDEDEWRKRHDRGMDEARREFLRLAQRLGIPPEKAERFLEENRPGRTPETNLEFDRDARRGPEVHFERDAARRAVEEAQGVLKDHGEAIEEAHEALKNQERLIREARRHFDEDREVVREHEHRLEKMERRLERMTNHLEEGGNRLEGIEDNGNRLERLERVVEKLVDKMVPHLERMQEEIDKLERAVRRLEDK